MSAARTTREAHHLLIIKGAFTRDRQRRARHLSERNHAVLFANAPPTVVRSLLAARLAIPASRFSRRASLRAGPDECHLEVITGFRPATLSSPIELHSGFRALWVSRFAKFSSDLRCGTVVECLERSSRFLHLNSLQWTVFFVRYIRYFLTRYW